MEPSEAVGLQEREHDRPPDRPKKESELKWKRQPSVRWFAPNVLGDAGLRVLISSAFGAFLDKRELQASVTTEPLIHQVEANQVWLDFIADTGDGFDPTYTVAWLASQAELRLANSELRLPRADLVVMGGDEVYPVGSPDGYENKLRGPYEASLPWLPPGSNPDLYAIPGNHDWYDGLTSFFRVFCQQRWIGGRRTRQTRSYFAIQLPRRWWIWGIDIQLDSYIDDPQINYFKSVKLEPDDKVILCTATPSWYEGPESQGYKNLDFVERTLITPRRARLMVSLSGDSHHYAHYARPKDGTHKVTAGGGGAFLHPTHPLTDELQLAMSQAEPDQSYKLEHRYPSKWASKRLACGAVGLPFFNPTFMVLPGVMYLLLAWSSQFSLRAFGNSGPISTTAAGYSAKDLLVGLFRNPVSVLMLIVFAVGLFGFAKPSKRRKEKWEKIVLKVPMAVFHLALHVAGVVVAALLAVKVASAWFDGGWQYSVGLLVAMAVLGAIIGGLLTGVYLAVCCALFNAHGNEAFSAMHLGSYKNFLRIHLDEDGVLTIYSVGIARPRRWELDPTNRDKSAPWFRPKGSDPVAHLIETISVRAQ